MRDETPPFPLPAIALAGRPDPALYFLPGYLWGDRSHTRALPALDIRHDDGALLEPVEQTVGCAVGAEEVRAVQARVARPAAES